VSPAAKVGTERAWVRRAICSASNCWMMFMVACPLCSGA
jgi:hypothetical protein